MKIGDLVTDHMALMPGVGIIISVRECMVQGELTGALSIESYWPEAGEKAIKRNNTHEPWFRYEVISENR